MIGFPEVILILVVVLIIFGPKNLPKLAKAIGESVHEYKKAVEKGPEKKKRKKKLAG